MRARSRSPALPSRLPAPRVREDSKVCLAQLKDEVLAAVGRELQGAWRGDVARMASAALEQDCAQHLRRSVEDFAKARCAAEWAELGGADLAALGTVQRRFEDDLQALSEETELLRERLDGVEARPDLDATAFASCACTEAVRDLDAQLGALRAELARGLAQAKTASADAEEQLAGFRQDLQRPRAPPRSASPGPRLARLEEDLRGRISKLEAEAAERAQRAELAERKVGQVEASLRGKAALVEDLAQRMHAVQTLEQSVSHLVTLCESSLDRHTRSIHDMELLLDEHHRGLAAQSEGVGAIDEAQRTTQSQLLRFQQQLATVMTTVSTRARSPSPAVSPCARKASVATCSTVGGTPSAGSPDPSSPAPSPGILAKLRAPRSRRRNELAPYLMDTPTP